MCKLKTLRPLDLGIRFNLKKYSNQHIGRFNQR